MYTEQQFNLPRMDGISEKQISEHLKLYAGYVKNTNALIEKIAEYKKDSEKNAHALSELVRRFPFEWNGMRMHEYYFEALGGNGKEGGTITQTLEKVWGGFDAWKNEFKSMGLMRGIGWVVLSRDNRSGVLHNTWVSDHELGHLAGANILIAMDVWEHAYLIDYPPAGRKDYIDAFFKNLNWDIVNKRLEK